MLLLLLADGNGIVVAVDPLRLSGIISYTGVVASYIGLVAIVLGIVCDLSLNVLFFVTGKLIDLCLKSFSSITFCVIAKNNKSSMCMYMYYYNYLIIIYVFVSLVTY